MVALPTPNHIITCNTVRTEVTHKIAGDCNTCPMLIVAIINPVLGNTMPQYTTDMGGAPAPPKVLVEAKTLIAAMHMWKKAIVQTKIAKNEEITSAISPVLTVTFPADMGSA